MAKFMAHAFDNRWIDMFPKQGKTGGAFCASNHELKLSRILTNFMGSFSDVSTLAHELGHAWHNECIRDYPLMMTEYTMPLAETASTFNETLLAQTVLQVRGRRACLLHPRGQPFGSHAVRRGYLQPFPV